MRFCDHVGLAREGLAREWGNGGGTMVRGEGGLVREGGSGGEGGNGGEYTRRVWTYHTLRLSTGEGKQDNVGGWVW